MVADIYQHIHHRVHHRRHQRHTHYRRKIKADGRMAELQKKWFGATFETPDAVKDPAF